MACLSAVEADPGLPAKPCSARGSAKSHNGGLRRDLNALLSCSCRNRLRQMGGLVGVLNKKLWAWKTLWEL